MASYSSFMLCITGSNLGPYSNCVADIFHVFSRLFQEYFGMVLSNRPQYFISQYSETNLMHFLFSLLRIKGLFMLRALLAHLQEAIYKRHLV
jgi:hypothetical protein